MPIESAAASAAPRHSARNRLAGMAGAVAVAAMIWLVARYGAGMQLRTPSFAGSQHPASLTVGLVLIASAVASLAGWGAVRLIGRSASRPRPTWIAIGALALIVSLSAPLAGHGITASQRLVLECLHLGVGTVLIPAFALTMPRRRPAKSTPAVPASAVTAPRSQISA